MYVGHPNWINNSGPIWQSYISSAWAPNFLTALTFIAMATKEGNGLGLGRDWGGWRCGGFFLHEGMVAGEYPNNMSIYIAHLIAYKIHIFGKYT